MKLLFVVRIDKPKRALADGVACFRNQVLETFDSHARSPDAHQFVYALRIGPACFQERSVDGLRQQVYEREFRGNANTDLLMAAKGIVPGREAEEHDAALSQKKIDAKKKLPFARWGNMFYDIVYKYEVVTLGFICGFICEKEILADECSVLLVFGKERAGLGNALLAHVNTRHLAAPLSKWKQIAALAATYFQHTCVCRERDVRLQIFQVELAGCVCQLTEVLFAVRMSLLHSLLLVCFSIVIDATKQEKTA